MGQREPMQFQRQPLRIGEGVGNRDLHIGNAELRNNRSIFEFHKRMDNRLRMNNNLDGIIVGIKEPFCLDYLQSFIHQRCRINRNLSPHRPVGMLQSLLRSYREQLFPLFSPERTTGSGEDNLAYIFFFCRHQAPEI